MPRPRGVNLKPVGFAPPQQTISPETTVSITAGEYAKLLRDSDELRKLRASLQNGKHENKSILTNALYLVSGHAAQANIQTTGKDNATRQSQAHLGSNGDLNGGQRFDLDSLASALEETCAVNTPESEDDLEARQRVNHSVILLPPSPVTHAQVAAAVRGGSLLQIFLQRNNNQVNVTFARSEDAAAFVAHAQSAPFYVAGLLTTVEWAPRGYVAPTYVYQQVQDGGVSRNLVIEKVDSKVTEAIIRRDLAHIHNLAVISVCFENGNAYISTSSAGGALYARTCMKSRAFYKDMRISFYEDECAKPLPRVRRSAVGGTAKASKKNKEEQGPAYNPFELLSQHEFDFDEEYYEEEEEEEHEE